MIEAGELGDVDRFRGAFQQHALADPEHPYDKAVWPVAGCGLGFGDMKVIEVYELLNAIATDAPLAPDFHASRKVQQTIAAILRSAAEARWVAIGDEVP